MNEPVDFLDGYRKLVRNQILLVAFVTAALVVVVGAFVWSNLTADARAEKSAERTYCVASLTGNAVGLFANALKGAPTTDDRNAKLDNAFAHAADLSNAKVICASGRKIAPISTTPPVLPAPPGAG